MQDGEGISNDELDSCARTQKVEIRRGDFVIVRTGQMERCLAEKKWGGYAGGDAPGVRFENCYWCQEKEIAAICSDTWGVEVRPNETTEAKATLGGDPGDGLVHGRSSISRSWLRIAPPTASTSSSSAVRSSSPAVPAHRSIRKRSSDPATAVRGTPGEVEAGPSNPRAGAEACTGLPVHEHPLIRLVNEAERPDKPTVVMRLRGGPHGPLPQARNGRERDQGNRRRRAATVEGILADVEARRDAAVRDLSRKFDNWSPASFRLTPAEIERALAQVPRRDLDDIKFAQQQVRNFAQKQKTLHDLEVETLRRRARPPAHPGRTRSAAAMPGGAIRWSPPPTCRS